MDSKGHDKIFLGDAATRGSQTLPVIISYPKSEDQASSQEPLWPKPTPAKRSRGNTLYPKSILADQDRIAANLQDNAKKRRTTPFSNWDCNPAPPKVIPTEFDLGGFCFTALPDPHRDVKRFNNDLVMDRYLPSARPYSGAQRKGINEPFPSAQSYLGRINGALQATFPLAEPTPLPADLLTALKFHREILGGR